MTDTTAISPTSAGKPAPLTEALGALRAARAALALSKGELAVKQRAFADENAALIEHIREDADIVAAHETIVRALALEAFAKTGERKPAAGVEIKMGKVYDIDEAAGLAWAKEKQLCLVPETLDLDAIKKLATVQALPFITITDAPKPFIASDLDKALADSASKAAA